MNESVDRTEGSQSLSEDRVNAALEELERVLGSACFEGKEQLREFLRYVVHETVQGRADSIRGKTIAADVYGRDDFSGGGAENAVRAHARRVRQQLGEYYRTDGKSSPVRIDLHSGSYAPSFAFVGDTEPAVEFERPVASDWRWRQVALGVVAGGALTAGAFALVYSLGADPARDTQTVRRAAEREAIFSKSATSLQAANLAAQARGLIFPVFDPDRQRLTSQLFLRVVDLDPQFYGGYAGASQSLASLAMLMPSGEERKQILDQANLLTQQALEIAPSEAWTQSAVGWTALANGDYDNALVASRRAFGIDPEEGNVLDFYAGAALFAGEFKEALEVADPSRVRKADKQRLAHRNIYGAASFHLGQYAQTLTAFREAAALGEPLSAASLVYQAAALHALDRKSEGRVLVQELMTNWPKANVAYVFERYYHDPAHATDLVDRLTELGWSYP